MLKENEALQQRDEFSARQAELSAAKRALLKKRLQGKLKSKKWTIPRRPDQGPAPLSFAQQRLWFLNQLMPASPFYNIPVLSRLMGPLNVAVLERALGEIVRRHEALRTTFTTVEGQPVQVIAPAQSVPLPVVDLRELSKSEREAKAQQLVTEEAQRPFNLVQGPLLRTTLLRLDENEHLMLLTIHHIVADAWSIRVLRQELETLYAAFCAGKPSPLPELPIQYADFAYWQRQWLQGERLETQLAYWKRQFDGFSLVLELPTDRLRPAVESFRGALRPLELPESLSAVPPDIGLARICRLFDVFKSNVQAMNRYMPRAYLGPITLFKAEEPLGEKPLDGDLGWGALASGDLTVHEMPGNHFTIVRTPNIEILAEQLKNHLRTAGVTHRQENLIA